MVYFSTKLVQIGDTVKVKENKLFRDTLEIEQIFYILIKVFYEGDFGLKKVIEYISSIIWAYFLGKFSLGKYLSDFYDVFENNYSL